MGNITIVTTIKAPLQETLMYVAYHLNLGIERIILFFSNPQDPAIAHLSALPQVTCIPTDDEYWRSRGVAQPQAMAVCERMIVNVNYGLELARDRGDEWIIHIDGDELLYPDGGDLKQIFAGYTHDVVRFELREAVSQQLSYPHGFATNLFRVPASKKQIWRARLVGCRSAFYRGQYFRGHSRSKVAVRTSASLERMDNHFPVPHANQSLPEEQTSRIKLLHFDCVGLATWKEKWVQRIEHSNRVNMRGNREKQFDQFKQALEEGDAALAALYQRLHAIPVQETHKLRKLNLLADISLNADLFVLPQPLEVAQ